MTVVELSPIVKAVEVRRTPDAAFRLFTEEISAWWPVKKHSRARDAAGEVTVRVDFEPRIGGRIYETLNTGEERDWGEVLAFEPGERLRFTFQMGRAKERSGEVEVTFLALGADACRVTLIHSHWERLGDEAPALWRGFDTGWGFVFVDGYGVYAGVV